MLNEVLKMESFKCPWCRKVSYHPKDVEEGYCGNCHDWTREKDKFITKREVGGAVDENIV